MTEDEQCRDSSQLENAVEDMKEPEQKKDR